MEIKKLTSEEYRNIAREQPTTMVNLDTAYFVKSVDGKNVEIEYAIKVSDVLKALKVIV